MKIDEILIEGEVVSFPTKRVLNVDVIDENDIYNISISIDFLYHDDNDIDTIHDVVLDAVRMINQEMPSEFDNNYQIKETGSGGGYGGMDYSFEIEGISGSDIEQLVLTQQWPQGLIMQIKYDSRLGNNIVVEDASIVMRDSESTVTKIDSVFRDEDGSPLDPSKV